MAKRRRGDRRDARLIRDTDPLHFFIPYIYPNRTDNEAVVTETIDLTRLNAYLEKKNAGRSDDKYTFMHALCAAIVKTVKLRPKMNRFYKGHRLYERDDVSLGFVVKKQFSDGGKEALAFLSFGGDATLDSIHERIMQEITSCRSEKLDNSTQGMAMFTHLPRWLMRIAMKILNLLDYYGRVPESLVKADPNHATAFISNLGSIRLSANYHHLFNWGTCSLFVVIGEKKWTPIFQRDGSYEMHETLDLSITLDERISDGYYYAKSIKLLKYLLQNPEALEERADKEVAYE